jgi:hypothetical protein
MKKASKVANVRKRGNRKKKEKPERRKKRREPKFDFHSPIQFISIQFNWRGWEQKPSNKLNKNPSPALCLSLPHYICASECLYLDEILRKREREV